MTNRQEGLICKAPQRGKCYAVLVDEVKYKNYDEVNKDQVIAMLKDENLLELHMFDETSEYRYIKTKGRGILESIVSDSSMMRELGCDEKSMPQHIYPEDVYVIDDPDMQEDLNQKVGIINYIQYDEDDMLHIVNYRLKEVQA